MCASSEDVGRRIHCIFDAVVRRYQIALPAAEALARVADSPTVESVRRNGVSFANRRLSVAVSFPGEGVVQMTAGEPMRSMRLSQDYVLTAEIRPNDGGEGSILELQSPSGLRIAIALMVSSVCVLLPVLLVHASTGVAMLASLTLFALIVGFFNRRRALSIQNQFASAVWSPLAAYELVESKDGQPYRALPGRSSRS